VPNPNLPCTESFNGTRLPYVFAQLDQAQDWIRSLVVNATTFGSICGDGRIGPNEECDDGNLNNGDGCNATCWVEGPTWHCFPSRAVYTLSNDDDDDNSGTPVLTFYRDFDICGHTFCSVLTHDHDDDGSSGSIIALIIVLSILGCCLLIALVVCCIMRRKRKARKAGGPIVVEEPMGGVMPFPVPIATMPASPIMMAPPSTPMEYAQIPMSPVAVEIISPAYGDPASPQVLPPIVMQEQIREAPRYETTAEMANPTWLKE
jgi:cysteine-rich repeat protein